MKILQLTYTLSSGGAERFVVDLCNELSTSPDNAVTLVAIVDDQKLGASHYLPELNSRVNYVCLHCKRGLSISSFWQVFRFILSLKPDVVHAHCAALLLFLPSIIYRRCKYVHTLHNVAQKTIPFNWMRGLYRYFYRALIQPVTISGVCDSSYALYYGLSNSVCIYNGRSPVRSSSAFEYVKLEIEAYKKIKGTPVFIHVARYAAQKNQQLLINVFEQLEAEGENFLLLILGAGHERADYYNRVDSPRIRFLGVKNNVGDYLACSDYFVLTSLWEGLPISLLEAMSFGCIPICTPAGGVIDVLNSPEVGYVSGSFSEADFYSLVKIVLKDNPAKKREKAKELYESQYTMQICAQNYLRLYQL